MLYNSIYIKFPEKAKLQRQKAEQLLLRAGNGEGIAANGYKGIFCVDENILTLGHGDGCTTVQIY